MLPPWNKSDKLFFFFFVHVWIFSTCFYHVLTSELHIHILLYPELLLGLWGCWPPLTHLKSSTCMGPAAIKITCEKNIYIYDDGLNKYLQVLKVFSFLVLQVFCIEPTYIIHSGLVLHKQTASPELVILILGGNECTNLTTTFLQTEICQQRWDVHYLVDKYYWHWPSPMPTANGDLHIPSMMHGSHILLLLKIHFNTLLFAYICI